MRLKSNIKHVIGIYFDTDNFAETKTKKKLKTKGGIFTKSKNTN